MKKIFSVFIWFTAFSGTAQTITVLDAENRTPVEFVTVISWEPKVYAVTDGLGRVDISAFVGSDSIVFQDLGHKEVSWSYKDLAAKEGGKLTLDRAAFNLGGVTISAAKWKQPKRDIPNRIVGVSAEQIYFENPQTSADLLESSGEVFVQKSQQGGGSPMIRGFSANRLMISMDGVRMNNAIFRSGNLQNVIAIDPLSIENTEVVMGPGTVIYGSDAIGGVMSFYSIEPDLALTNDDPLVKGNVLVRGSSANREQTGHIDFNIGYEKWAFVTSLSYSDYDDLQMGRNGSRDYLRYEYVTTENGIDRMAQNPNARIQRSSGYSQTNIMQKVRYKPSRFVELSYGGHFSISSDIDRYDRLLRYNGDTLRSAEWYYGPQEWMMHNVRLIVEKPNLLYDKMSIVAAYQTFKESRNNRDYGSAFKTNRTERVYAPSLNLDFEQDIGERHEIFYGLEAVYNWIDSRASVKNINSGNNALIQTRYPHQAQWMTGAVYVSDRFRFSERATFIGGIRYNMVRIEADLDTSFLSLPITDVNINADALNGSLGLAYKPDEKTQININASTGFRAPNVDDIGKVFDSEPERVVVPSSNIESEYVYNAEIGVIKIFKEFLKLELSGYYSFLNNALVRRNDQLNGSDSIIYDGVLSQVQSVQNAAFAQVYGMHVGCELKVWKAWNLGTTLNIQEGKEELDDGSVSSLRHAPPIFGNARLGYRFKRFKAQLSANYNGEVSHLDLPLSESSKEYLYAADNNGNPFSPSWIIFDIRTTFQANDRFHFSGSIENILDRRYRPYSSGLVAPGRNFIAAINYKF